MLVFFAVMISRAVIDRIGLLDEDFGVGLGDDDAYCWSAQQAGFDLCYLGDLTIWHHHKATFTQLYTHEEIRRMGWDAVDKLRAKSAGSSIVPQACRYTRPSNI
jgi:GT2 family glycosyltransferase